MISGKIKAQNPPKRIARIVFYNTENLFHPSNDSLKKDNDFTPEGMKHWTIWRYRQKLFNIYKVITAIGEGEMPEIIGFCEVENAQCLKDLINQTPLFLYSYQYLHYESPDNRGIDVALVYRSDKFQIIKSENIPIHFPKELSTRRGLLANLKMKGFEANEMSLFLNGSGDVFCDGSATNLEIEQNGSGDANLSRLKVANCRISKSGSGDASVNVSGELDIYSRGSGDLIYRGGPDITNIDSKGSGDVKTY